MAGNVSKRRGSREGKRWMVASTVCSSNGRTGVASPWLAAGEAVGVGVGVSEALAAVDVDNPRRDTGGWRRWRLAAVQRAARAVVGRVDSLASWKVTPRTGAGNLVMAGRRWWLARVVEFCRETAADRAQTQSLKMSRTTSSALFALDACHAAAMAALTPSMRQFSACLRCVHAAPRRLLSSSAAAREEVRTQPSSTSTTTNTPPPPPPPSNTPAPTSTRASPQDTPEYMQKWGILDPKMVENKKQERRLLRRDHVQPVGSRRRRAALRRGLNKAPEVPFEQLPYQCFQEARKVLLQDRQEKLAAIETQQQRIRNVMEQDPAVSGGAAHKETRIRSMKKHLNDLVILADINDPMVKRKFEDGQGGPLWMLRLHPS